MHGPVGLEKVVGNLVVILGASVAVLFASHRLRLSPVVGLLATGMLIGPSGLGWIDRHSVEVFAELGVVLLLFTVGLEVSLVRLKRHWRPFLLGGGGQVLTTIAATAGIAVAFGATWRVAIFLGFLASLSSTAIVLKIYGDRGELPSPQGMFSAGVLLFQDFCIAPMIILVPVLAGNVDVSPLAVIGRIGLGLAIVGLAFLAARLVMPRVLEWIVGTRTREVFLLGALTICLAMALGTSYLGFSLAFGAFLAGLIISESEYSHQVVAEILPLRDVFNSLFFISIGMLLDLQELPERWPLVVGAGLAIVVGKMLITTAIAGLLGYATRIAVIGGTSLAQVGEFSLVLAGVGIAAGLLEESVFQVFLGAAILTMLVTPLLISRAPRLADRAAAVPLPRPRVDHEMGRPEETAEMTGHVIVVGYGLNGRNLSRVLRSTGIPFVILELNGNAVREGRRRDDPVFFGDATRPDILAAHGIERAATLVVGIAEVAATRRIVRLARAANPSIHIVVRTRTVEQVEELRHLGANEVVPEEFETSLELFSRVLAQYHVPPYVARAQRALIRDESYGIFRDRRPEGAERHMRVGEILEAALTETFLVTAGSAADGRTLQELDLRRRSGGASVIAVVRSGKAETSPPPDLRLAAHDNLVLVGAHEALSEAVEILSAPAETLP